LYYYIIMDDNVYPNETASFFSITAMDIHIYSSNKPPKSNWVNALNSFILSVREVDVSQAPSRGLKPLRCKFIPTIRLILSKIKFYFQNWKIFVFLYLIARTIVSIFVKGRLIPNAVLPLSTLRGQCIP